MFKDLPQYKRFKSVIDDSFFSAVENYFDHDIDAGHCAMSLINGDYMEAWFNAHRLIQPIDVWRDYYDFGKAIQLYKEKI